MTGGATGIGNAIKQQLIGQGHSVLVVDIKNADIIADLSTSAGRQAAIDGIRAHSADGLDGFIPCAGVGPMVSPPSLVSSINYFGAVVVTEGVRDLLVKKNGAIVMVSSNSAPMGYDQTYTDLLLAGDEAKSGARVDELGQGQTAYGGSKFALTCWMRANASSYAADGVRINAVAPGFTQTPLTDAAMQDKDFSESMKQFVETIPVGKAGLPDDIANGVSFLLSEKASFVVGSVLFIDGGHDAVFRPNDF
mgnify:CR=1 FL=1